MNKFLTQQIWSWKASGVALAIMFFITVAIVKPIGVSTQFVILDGIIWNAVSSDLIVEDGQSKTGYSSSNEYLNKSSGKYAKSIENPLNYGFIFVLAMVAGGFIATKVKSKEQVNDDDDVLPVVWKKRFGDSNAKRYIVAFLAGMLVLFGARLAGGCTSGHMMSGMMQTSLSGYLFSAGAFAAAIPTAIFMYKKGDSNE